MRGRRVRRWWPDGDRREMARWRNRRGVHLDVASAATLWPGWVSSGELGGGTFEGTSRSNRIRARADGLEVHHLTGRDRGQSSSASPSGPSRLLWNCFACIRVPAWERDIDPRHLRDHVPCPVKQMTAAKSPNRFPYESSAIRVRSSPRISDRCGIRAPAGAIVIRLAAPVGSACAPRPGAVPRRPAPDRG